jgi:hypothetical protein
MVEWDLRGTPPRLQATVPHPNVYLVFEQNLEKTILQPLPQEAAEVSGVTTGKFSRHLEGWSRVVGVKFKPGRLLPLPQESSIHHYRSCLARAANLWAVDAGVGSSALSL